MKLNFLPVSVLALFFFADVVSAQTTPPASATRPTTATGRPDYSRIQEPQIQTNYNYHDAFAPFFYTKNGNEYRSAGGQPGPKYWQNRADYQLAVSLNDQTNEISRNGNPDLHQQ